MFRDCPGRIKNLPKYICHCICSFCRHIKPHKINVCCHGYTIFFSILFCSGFEYYFISKYTKLFHNFSCRFYLIFSSCAFSTSSLVKINLRSSATTVIYYWGYTIEIIDIECVLGHESCLHFFRKCPFKSAMLNLTRS